MYELAIKGGTPVIWKKFPPYNSIGIEEINAANRVLESGILSAYVAEKGESFLGGEEVKALEEEVAEFFDVNYAIAVNSWTSGLIASVGAIGIEPGDEIIVTPWTMVATATAILHWNAIPVFADIDYKTFNLDPNDVEKKITERTKAIVYADIFGQSADVYEFRKIANKYNLKLIADTAQAPIAKVGNKYAGCLADVGGFSLNYHKHIHCGEGGIIVTNDSNIAQRLQLIRNHGEAVIQDNSSDSELANIIGYNFRLGEIEAAIAREQLKKLDNKVKSRQRAANQLRNGLKELRGLIMPFIQSNMTHSYYVFGMRLELDDMQHSREWIVNALRAEGAPISSGYQCIHLNPIFQRRIAYGVQGFPWRGLSKGDSSVEYNEGICPIAEYLHKKSFIGIGLCAHNFTEKECKEIINCFEKVWKHVF